LLNFTYLRWTHYAAISCPATWSVNFMSRCLAFSCPAISCPATWSVNFMSCIFMSCCLVRHFHVLLFHALQLGPSISCPAISCPSFSAPPSIPERLGCKILQKERYTCIPLPFTFHWLRIPERIQFRLCFLAYRHVHGTAPAYLSDSLRPTSEIVACAVFALLTPPHCRCRRLVGLLLATAPFRWL